MRLPSQASSALAVVAVSLSCGACTPVGEERAEQMAFGSDLMAQQAPRQQSPQVARPTGSYDGRHPRMVEGELPGRYPFYWTRAIYSGYRGRGWRQSWATDYPKGDQQFLVVLKRLVRLNAYDWDNAVRLDDPILRRFPVLYAVEVGGMDMTDAEVEGLRGYLDAGGFLIVDDFWGSREWDIFEYNIRRVYPDRPIVDIGIEHPLYSAFYQIDAVLQVPARGRGIFGRPTEECYGCYPAVRGIYDDKGRLSVIINFNTDLGDAWEWAEDPYYPLKYSTYAYEMGANMIVYAMSH
jgi:uncharacterized protein DUF4159